MSSENGRVRREEMMMTKYSRKEGLKAWKETPLM
jgi:hypothetical protein